MIKNRKDFENFLSSEQCNQTPFSKLSEEDLAFFLRMVHFSEDGNVSGYWGDVAVAGKLDDDQVAELASRVFGVEKDWFILRYHQFGDGEKCIRRLYWNCPD